MNPDTSPPIYENLEDALQIEWAFLGERVGIQVNGIGTTGQSLRKT